MPLENQPDHLHPLLDRVPLVIYSKNLENHTFDYVNAAITKLTGLSPAKFMSLTEDEFNQRIHPEDRDLFIKPLNTFLTIISHDQEDLRLQYRFQHASGSYVQILDHATIQRDEDGNPQKLIGSLISISEQPSKFSGEYLQADTSSSSLGSDFQRIADKLYEGIWEIDANEKTVYVNPRMAEILGYKQDEMIGLSLYDFMDDEAKQSLHKYLTQRHAGKSEQHEFEFLHKDGHRVFSFVATSPLRDHNDNYLGAVAAISDISLLKQAERELQEKEELMRDTTDNLPGLIMTYILKPDGSDEILFISQGVKSIYELNPEDVIEDSSLLWDVIHPDDLEKMTNSVQESAQKLNPWYLEFRIVMPDGTIKWLVGRGMPRKMPDGSTYWNTMLIDETSKINAEVNLRESERKFRVLIEGVNSVIYTFNKDFEFTYISPASLGSTGYQPGDLKNKSPFDLIYHDDLEVFKNFISDSLNTKQTKKGVEYRIIKKDGSIGWRSGSVTPFLNNHGEITGYLGISYDIESLKDKEKELAEAIAMKDKLFSIIGHDLKSPLNSILGLTEIMVDNVNRGEVEEVKELFDWVRKSSQKSVDLLSNLLEWARSQTGDLLFTPQSEKVLPLLQSSVEVVEDAAAEKQVEIKTNVDPELSVMADENMLRTVLRNLLSNAVKYTNKNGKIEANAHHNEQGILFSIKDNGVGIPSHNLNKIFASDKPHTTEGTGNEKGTGLGLLICKDFVEKQGGKIWVESEENKGATFFFTLPAVAKEQKKTSA